MRRTIRWSLALVAVLVGFGCAAATASARTVDYWIAAVPVTWNVVPNGHDAIMRHDASRPSDTVFPTVVYRQLHDATGGRPIAERAGRLE